MIETLEWVKSNQAFALSVIIVIAMAVRWALGHD
jgi:hypothetical protein